MTEIVINELNKIETLKEELTDDIEKMNEYQLRLVRGFVKTLFNLPD